MRLLLFMMFFPFSFHGENNGRELLDICLLYTSDAADE